MQLTDQIRAAVQQVTELRKLARSNPALFNALSEVKQIQSRRFTGTYSDLLSKESYQAAVHFFWRSCMEIKTIRYVMSNFLEFLLILSISLLRP